MTTELDTNDTRDSVMLLISELTGLLGACRDRSRRAALQATLGVPRDATIAHNNGAAAAYGEAICLVRAAFGEWE